MFHTETIHSMLQFVIQVSDNTRNSQQKGPTTENQQRNVACTAITPQAALGLYAKCGKKLQFD